MIITVLMGSPRKKDSYRICHELTNRMLSEHCEIKYVFTDTYKIHPCKGCNQCFKTSELSCPCNDELSLLVKELNSSDGLIIASPVYAYQVPSEFKKIIDRLAFYFHRQELVGIPCVNVITSEGGGHKDVKKYLKMLTAGWGCHYVGSISVISPLYFENQSNGVFKFDDAYKTKIDKRILSISDKFMITVVDANSRIPSFYDLLLFNGLRSKIYTSKADYDYWEEKRWIKADYFSDVPMGIIKRGFSQLMRQVLKGLILRL